MTKEDLSDSLNFFLSNPNTITELNYVEKKANKNYCFYRANIENNLQNEISRTVITNVLESILNKEIQEYDSVGVPDETIEYLTANDIDGLTKYNQCFSYSCNFSDETPENQKIAFYALKVSIDTNRHVTFFKRYSVPSALDKSYFLKYIPISNQFAKLDDKLLFVYRNADVILIDNTFIIFNRYAFEVIMNYKDNFFTTLDSALSIIRGSDILTGFDRFENDCKESVKIAKKFTQIMKKGNLTRIIDNKNKLAPTLELLQLDIEFNQESQQIVYNDQSQLQTIITILSDGFAKTLIADRTVAIELERPID